jgi:hypothetical protein
LQPPFNLVAGDLHGRSERIDGTAGVALACDRQGRVVQKSSDDLLEDTGRHGDRGEHAPVCMR